MLSILSAKTYDSLSFDLRKDHASLLSSVPTLQNADGVHQLAPIYWWSEFIVVYSIIAGTFGEHSAVDVLFRFASFDYRFLSNDPLGTIIVEL